MVTHRIEITRAKIAIAIIIEEPILTDDFGNTSPPLELKVEKSMFSLLL
jgi:hypothetical protein